MNIKLQTHQLLSIFPEMHPFIELVDPVKPPEHALPLAIVRQTAMIWHEAQFWNETSMADDATIQIDYEKLGISAEEIGRASCREEGESGVEIIWLKCI